MSREVSKTKFEGAAPILSVKDVSASVRYYVNVLGFRNADWGTEDFTSVSRDGAGYLSLPRRSGMSRHLGVDRCRRRGSSVPGIQGQWGENPRRASQLSLGTGDAC